LSFGFLFLYDQELTYTMDNPWGNPLFLLCAVRTEGQERDNQMTTGVNANRTDFRFLLFHFRTKLADLTAATAGADEDSETMRSRA